MIKLTKTTESGWVDNVTGTVPAEWVVKKAPPIEVFQGFGWCAVEHLGGSERRFLVRHAMSRKDCLRELQNKRPELAD